MIPITGVPISGVVTDDIKRKIKRNIKQKTTMSYMSLPLKCQIPHPVDLFDFDDARVMYCELYNIPVIRLGLIVYYDDFNVYNKVYHSTGGCYIQISNLDRRLRDALDNWFLLLLSSPGCVSSNVFKMLRSQLIMLQRGLLFDIGDNERVFIIASVHVAMADTPQAADLAGCKRHTANVPCHCCKAPKDVVKGVVESDATYSESLIPLHTLRRNPQTTLFDRKRLAAIVGTTSKDEFCTQHGLSDLASPFEWTGSDGLLFNQHLQVTPEILHADLLGLIDFALSSFLYLLLPAALHRFNRFVSDHINKIRYPGWERLDSLLHIDSTKKGTSHKVRYTGTERLRFMQLAPYLLRLFYSAEGVRSNDEYSGVWANNAESKKELDGSVLEDCDAKRRFQYVMQAWTDVAVVLGLVYERQRRNKKSAIMTRSRRVVARLKRFLDVFPMHWSKPKIHQHLHYAAVEDWFALIRLCDCGRGEAFHAQFRGMSRNINNHDVEGDLMHRYNADASLWYYLKTLKRFPSMNPSVDKAILDFVQHPAMQAVMYRKTSLKLQLLRQNAARPESQSFITSDYDIVDSESLIVCGIDKPSKPSRVVNRSLLLDLLKHTEDDDSDSDRYDSGTSVSSFVTDNDSDDVGLGMDHKQTTPGGGSAGGRQLFGQWSVLDDDDRVELGRLYSALGVEITDLAAWVFAIDWVFTGHWRHRARMLYVGDYVSSYRGVMRNGVCCKEVAMCKIIRILVHPLMRNGGDTDPLKCVLEVEWLKVLPRHPGGHNTFFVGSCPVVEVDNDSNCCVYIGVHNLLDVVHIMCGRNNVLFHNVYFIA
jgi:hypothetical protein